VQLILEVLKFKIWFSVLKNLNSFLLLFLFLKHFHNCTYYSTLKTALCSSETSAFSEVAILTGMGSEMQGGTHEVCYPWDCMLQQMYEARNSLPTELTIYNSQFGADISGRHPPPLPQSLCKPKAIPQTAKNYDPWKLNHGRKQNQFCSRWYRYIFIPPSTHYLLFYERRSSERWDETKTRCENILRGQLQQLEPFGPISLATVLTRQYRNLPGS
jgi:hypothetical protein